MSGRHVVWRAEDARPATPTSQPWAGATGFARWEGVGEGTPGAVHTGFDICELAPGGSVPACVGSYEQSVFVLEGDGQVGSGDVSVVLQTPGEAALLRPGDYGLIPVGVPHSWRNESGVPVRWAQMLAPQRRSRHAGDTIALPPLPATAPVPVDPRDPRTRRYGHIEPSNMDVTKQNQELLALSASMRTALLVYSGITVKMMVDSDLGATLSTMFMVHYDPNGTAGPHDHPFEESYLFLEGRAEGVFDGVAYELGPGDLAFAGVGCVHSFRNLGGGPLRWLETQAPQPPARHSYRFRRDWDYLSEHLEGER